MCSQRPAQPCGSDSSARTCSSRASQRKPVGAQGEGLHSQPLRDWGWGSSCHRLQRRGKLGSSVTGSLSPHPRGPVSVLLCASLALLPCFNSEDQRDANKRTLCFFLSFEQ